MFLNIVDPRERKKKTTLVLWNESQKVPSRKSVSKIQRIPCGQGNLDGGQIGYTCSNVAGNIVTFPAGRPPINFTELSTVQISSSEKWSDWNSTCTNPNITLKKHTFKTSHFIKKATGKNIFPDLSTVLRTCIDPGLRVKSFSYQYEQSVKRLSLRETVAVPTFSPSCFSFRNRCSY